MWQFKTQKTLFKGYYEKDRKGERNFILVGTRAPFRRITFESFQAAKKLGYVYIKN